MDGVSSAGQHISISWNHRGENLCLNNDPCHPWGNGTFIQDLMQSNKSHGNVHLGKLSRPFTAGWSSQNVVKSKGSVPKMPLIEV